MAVLATLVAPAPAAAHVRSSAVAVDYRASVLPLSPALAARVYGSDLALGLTVRDGHTVVVYGYDGEPFLRLDSTGVAVNAASPTAVEAGLLEEPDQVEGPGPAWETVSDGRTVIWHDRRLRRPPAGVERWEIPLAVDGARVALAGEVQRVSAPPPWPWLGLGAVFAALTAIAVVRRRPAQISRAAVALGATAGMATVVLAVGFAVHSGASAARWVEGGNELVLAAAGLAVLARGAEEARAGACSLLGLLALFTGLLKIEVLTKGVVLSALPDALARGAVAVAISAGAAALVVGALAFHAAHRSPDSPGSILDL